MDKMLERINTAFGLAQLHVSEFVAVAFKKQTYMNILYLLFTFPLGTAYFVFLITGLSLGFHLVGVWIGVPILLLVFLAWWEMASFERQLAEWLLGLKMPTMSREQLEADSLLDRWIVKLKNPVTWKALLFLLMKFPLGIFSLAVAAFMLILTLFLLMSPLMYYAGYSLLSDGPRYAALTLSVAAFFTGIPVGLLSLHAMNFLAKLSGRFAVLMLGASQKNDDLTLQEM
jgi:hypothetical protein